MLFKFEELTYILLELPSWKMVSAKRCPIHDLLKRFRTHTSVKVTLPLVKFSVSYSQCLRTRVKALWTRWTLSDKAVSLKSFSRKSWKIFEVFNRFRKEPQSSSSIGENGSLDQHNLRITRMTSIIRVVHRLSSLLYRLQPIFSLPRLLRKKAPFNVITGFIIFRNIEVVEPAVVRSEPNLSRSFSLLNGQNG